MASQEKGDHNQNRATNGDDGGTAEQLSEHVTTDVVDGSDGEDYRGVDFLRSGDDRPSCLSPARPESLPSLPTTESSIRQIERELKALRFEPEKRPVLPTPPGGFLGNDLFRNVVQSATEPTTIDTANTEGNPKAREGTAQRWIEAVTTKPFTPFDSHEFARNIKSGQRLCSLVNTIRPGMIPHVYKSQVGYDQMQNVENFLTACLALGVQDHHLVHVTHIFEMKDTPFVVECVHALGKAVQSSCPAFDGPRLGRPSPPVTSILAAGFSNTEKGLDDDSMYGDYFKRGAKCTGTSPEEVNAEKFSRGLMLNMDDVERPRSFGQTLGRTSNSSVGSVNDLRPPTPLSSRAQKMCPEELVASPRALVFNADPIGHPARSPTIEALAATPGSTKRALGGVWGPGGYRLHQSPKTACSRLSSTAPFPKRGPPSPAGEDGRSKDEVTPTAEDDETGKFNVKIKRIVHNNNSNSKVKNVASSMSPRESLSSPPPPQVRPHAGSEERGDNNNKRPIRKQVGGSFVQHGEEATQNAVIVETGQQTDSENTEDDHPGRTKQRR